MPTNWTGVRALTDASRAALRCISFPRPTPHAPRPPRAHIHHLPCLGGLHRSRHPRPSDRPGVPVRRRWHRTGAHSGLVPAFAPAESHERAYAWWRRAAAQGDVKSKMMVGDYHYYGKGAEPDAELAAQYYSLAEGDRSAQAAFNLGYMHEHGLGGGQVRHGSTGFGAGWGRAACGGG